MQRVMANYKTHTRFNLFLALPLLLAMGWYLFNLSVKELALFTGAFAYATLWMSPDSDVAYQVKLFSFRGLMTLPFRPYAYLFKHRGLSHKPVIGTATRLLWVLLLTLLVLYGLYEFVPTQETFLGIIKSYKEPLIIGLSAITIADLCHLLLDL